MITALSSFAFLAPTVAGMGMGMGMGMGAWMPYMWFGLTSISFANHALNPFGRPGHSQVIEVVDRVVANAVPAITAIVCPSYVSAFGCASSVVIFRWSRMHKHNLPVQVAIHAFMHVWGAFFATWTLLVCQSCQAIDDGPPSTMFPSKYDNSAVLDR